VPKGKARGSSAVRQALKGATEEARVGALIGVLTGENLPAALEAMELLVAIGPPAVPRLVSEMRRARNNWLIGGTLAKMGSTAVAPLLELLEEADDVTVVDCLYLLGEIQDRRALPTLIRYLEDPREQVRMYAVSSLLQIGGPRAVEAVLSRLTREGKGLESFIVDLLLRYGRKSVEPIIQNLTSQHSRVRSEASYLLGGLGDARAEEPLAFALEDEDPEVRQNAAYALGQLSDSISEPEGVIRGLARLLSDPAPPVVEAARGALIRFGDRSVGVLLEVCRNGDTDEVVEGLTALRTIGDPRAEEVMIGLLEHPRRSVRIAAVSGLIAAGTGRAVEPLLNALRDEDLRWFAALALEKLGGENPRLFFATRPNDPTMSLRIQILLRLGSSIVPVLVEFLGAENLARRAWALWLLGEIGEPDTAREVAELLTDPLLGWLAGLSLERMGEPGLEELLRRVAFPADDEDAVQLVETLALFDDARAWKALVEIVVKPFSRDARVRSAVLVSMYGDAVDVDRLRAYLDTEGHALWPDVKAALQAEGQIR
jgi:HEAT repeat protein